MSMCGGQHMWVWAPLRGDHEEGGGANHQRMQVKVGAEKYVGLSIMKRLEDIGDDERLSCNR